MQMASGSNTQAIRSIAAAAVVVTATAFLVQTAGTRSGDKTKDLEQKASQSRKKWESETWESHLKEHGPLKEVWPETLFVLEATGVDQGPPVRNMTIYRVPDGSRRLVIFNGVAVDERTMKELEGLGVPTVLVAPNCYHRCCAAVWKKRFPEIMVVCPGIARETVSNAVVVDAATEEWTEMADWTKWVHTKNIDGWGDFENIIEVELTRGADGKRAVLVCDLLFTVPLNEGAGFADRFFVWLFDSSIKLPPEGDIIIPKVARLSRIFAIKDWRKAEQWYRKFALEHGKDIAVVAVGHGPPVVEVDAKDGCTKAFEGVAEQLTKPRW